MADTEIVEIGFKGGQVIAVTLTEAKLKDLRKALEKPEGFADVETKGGTIAIALSEVSSSAPTRPCRRSASAVDARLGAAG